MKLVLVVTLLVGLLLSDSEAQRTPLTKLSYTSWINLLRYAHKTLQREEPVAHDSHFNRTGHIDLIASQIDRHFFNDHVRPMYTEQGRELVSYRVPVDLMILLDSSASVGSENFENAIQVLTALIGILDDSAFADDKIRVGMISFSEPDKVEHEFEFSARQDKQTVLDQINATQYHSGTSTSTAQALWIADKAFSKNSRSNATRVMLLVTDGWSHNELQLPFGVLWPAARLRKLHNVHSYVIGIGDQINHNELVAVASRPTDRHLFEVEDYSMMLEVVDKVRQLQAPSDD